MLLNPLSYCPQSSWVGFRIDGHGQKIDRVRLCYYYHPRCQIEMKLALCLCMLLMQEIDVDVRIDAEQCRWYDEITQAGNHPVDYLDGG